MRRILLTLCLMGCDGSVEVSTQSLPVEHPPVEIQQTKKSDGEDAEQVRESRLEQLEAEVRRRQRELDDIESRASVLRKEIEVLQGKMSDSKLSSKNNRELSNTAQRVAKAIRERHAEMTPVERALLLKYSAKYMSQEKLGSHAEQFLDREGFPALVEPFQPYAAKIAAGPNGYPDLDTMLSAAGISPAIAHFESQVEKHSKEFEAAQASHLERGEKLKLSEADREDAKSQLSEAKTTERLYRLGRP